MHPQGEGAQAGRHRAGWAPELSPQCSASAINSDGGFFPLSDNLPLSPNLPTSPSASVCAFCSSTTSPNRDPSMEGGI